jgi:DNA (cytosine-5)-methyltransferase 1
MIDIKDIDKKLIGYSFIDLFAGIGGFHYALSSFGADCVFASEIDEKASHTYNINHKIAPSGDITNINEADIPNHDILCAGFPCQAFSISGKQKGFEDTRGTLFFDIARIVDHHKPKVLFLENVKNFIKHDGGNTLKTVVNVIVKMGYNVYYEVLNTSNFGLPQNRERVYIVAFRNDVDNSTFHFPSFIMKSKLIDILEDNPKNGKIIKREDISIDKDYIPQTNMFGESEIPNKPIQIGKVNKGGQGERIYHPLGHAITLSAYGGGAGSKTGLYKIEDVIRKLSPRECARLQGFPESFIYPSSISEAHKQFGNSVSINVLQYITQEIINVLEYNEKEYTTRFANGKTGIQKRKRNSIKI